MEVSIRPVVSRVCLIALIDIQCARFLIQDETGVVLKTFSLLENMSLQLLDLLSTRSLHSAFMCHSDTSLHTVLASVIIRERSFFRAYQDRHVI